MTINVTKEQIREIIEIALDRELDDFDMDTNFYEGYEMDSLGAVALVVEVQKKYQVKVPEEEIPNILTGNDLKAFIEKLVSQKEEENA